MSEVLTCREVSASERIIVVAMAASLAREKRLLMTNAAIVSETKKRKIKAKTREVSECSKNVAFMRMGVAYSAGLENRAGICPSTIMRRIQRRRLLQQRRGQCGKLALRKIVREVAYT